MAHQQQVEFCKSVKQRIPKFFANRLVVNIGALDINGNNQYLFEDCLYLGVDLMPGRNVDLVAKGHELNLPDESVDVVISTECLEHDLFYPSTLGNAVRMLKPGGLLLLTCATTGRGEHGTRRTTPADAPFTQQFGEWGDYYKNLEESDIRAVLDLDAIFDGYSFSTNSKTHDLYFWGTKKGELIDRYDYSFQLQQSALYSALRSRENFITELLKAVSERDRRLVHLNRAVAQRDKQLVDISQVLDQRDIQIAQLLSSPSWRLTKPLRFARRLLRGDLKTAFLPLRGKLVGRVARMASRTRRAAGCVLRGDVNGLVRQIKARKQPSWGIMTTQHALFIAHLIADRLRVHGWNADIMTEAPVGFHHDRYVVICPQMFKRLPPAGKRIVFQMEQSVSSRWFTNAYLGLLKNSLAVFEYALANVDFLASKGVAYPHVHYLPIGASTTYGDSIVSSKKSDDVLFYGDIASSPRRREMLDVLKRHFSVREASELFGRDMLEAIKQSRLVVNLHYYEDALLETPRIQECLTLSVPVVSESSRDQQDYPELAGAVRFFEQGSIPAMLDAVKAALEDPVPTEKIAEAVERSAQRFAFMFDRALLAMGFLPASHVSDMSLPLSNSADRVVLSLPETIGRRRAFEAEQPAGCTMFDGIRCRPGWVGCGLSYMAIAQHAIKQGKRRLSVMEDDVILPADFEAKMAVVNEFLDARSGQWDVFAGVIASLHPEAGILSVEVFKGVTFVTINKMTSTVFNVYSEKALRLLASWDPENQDATSNTIDRFLENQADLRVVVVLPFLVGHREEAYSTLWGFQNVQYVNMIANSEQMLKNMMLAYYKAPHGRKRAG